MMLTNDDDDRSRMEIESETEQKSANATIWMMMNSVHFESKFFDIHSTHTREQVEFQTVNFSLFKIKKKKKIEKKEKRN